MQFNHPFRMPVLSSVIMVMILTWSHAVFAGSQPDGADEQVRERALARWEALLAGDIEKAYDFTAPSFRSAVSMQAYRARFGASVRWTDSRIRDISCDGEQRCKVTMMVDYRVPRLGIGNQRAIEETWLLIDGEWWLHQTV